MSSTNRGGERRPLDAYYTPTELADAIVRRLVVDGMIERSRALRVLEPHAGTGAFVRALRVALPGARIVANDVQPLMAEWRQAGADECRIGDFAGMRGEYDAIVGNPPFSLAERHVRLQDRAAR